MPSEKAPKAQHVIVAFTLSLRGSPTLSLRAPVEEFRKFRLKSFHHFFITCVFFVVHNPLMTHVIDFEAK